MLSVIAMSPRHELEAVLFDLGGTIVRTVEPYEIHRRILEAHGINVRLEDVSRAHQNVQEEYDADKMAEMGLIYWVKWNLKILEQIGIQKDKELLARKIDELWFDYADLETYPDVPETLAQLKAIGVKTGIVTNGFERDYRNIFQKLGLAGLFDVAVGVDNCGKAKPNSEIFHYALNRLCVKKGETLFVGDSVKLDYEGARRAGLKALLIDREGKAPQEVEAIRSLTEVLDYV